jgi:1-acyl-sn-glycerol-3-phosphate acyltransferase
MKKMLSFLSFVPAYCAGVFIAVSLTLLRALRIWKIKGMDNIPTLKEKGDRGLLVVSNHLSLLEPIALIGLFAHWYLFNLKYGPWNIAEKANFKRGLFCLMETRIIFVERGSVSSRVESLRRARAILEDGGIVLVFPEGGRTCSCRPGEKLLMGRNGKVMREFKGGAAHLASHTNAMVLPIWVDGTDRVSPNGRSGSGEVARYPFFLRLWRCVDVNIGTPIDDLHGQAEMDATHVLEAAVLSLSAIGHNKVLP